MLNAGKLRHVVTIQKPVRAAPNALGERIASWQDVCTIHAAIEPQTGRQLEYARSFSATVTHKITARYQPGILPTYRILFGARVFEIKAVIDLEERRRELNFYCTEVVAT